MKHVGSGLAELLENAFARFEQMGLSQTIVHDGVVLVEAKTSQEEAQSVLHIL